MFDQVIAVNVKGVFLGMRHVLRSYRAEIWAVVNTASVAGLVATPACRPIVASKHAVIGLTKTGPRGGAPRRQGQLRLSWPVDTRMIIRLSSSSIRAIRRRSPALSAAQPTGRYTTADEIANTVLFLCSDLASNTTARIRRRRRRTATGGSVQQVRRLSRSLRVGDGVEQGGFLSGFAAVGRVALPVVGR